MSQIQTTDRLIAKPGHGVDRVTLGLSTQEVKRVLGKPESTNTYSDEIWWSYFDLGIDCGFRRDTKTLMSLNFFRDGIAGHSAAKVTTEEGLCPGVPKLVVFQRLGVPLESGADWIDRLGKWHRSWVAYREGIAFEFGRDGRVDLMTIYNKTEKSAEKHTIT